MEQLRILAEQFRKAIEDTPPHQLPITMRSFPAGACGDVTVLLGHHLKAQGFGVFDYVLGFRGEGVAQHSHAWLRQGDIVIDITADQFAEVSQPVIVAAGSAWHDGFDTEIPHEADFLVYDPRTKATLQAAYWTVLQLWRPGHEPAVAHPIV